MDDAGTLNTPYREFGVFANEVAPDATPRPRYRLEAIRRVGEAAHVQRDVCAWFSAEVDAATIATAAYASDRVAFAIVAS